jgi:hypothetical protein
MSIPRRSEKHRCAAGRNGHHIVVCLLTETAASLSNHSAEAKTRRFVRPILGEMDDPNAGVFSLAAGEILF